MSTRTTSGEGTVAGGARAEDGPGQRRPAGQPRWVLALTSTAALMVMLDMLVVTTALAVMRSHFHVPVSELEWTVNAYTLSYAVLMMTAAAVGDRIGRRRLMTAGLVLFTTASAVCALVPTIGWLVVARAVQGAGSAMVVPAALAILGEAFPGESRARALGLFAGVTGLATLGGPLVGGAVVQWLSWQWIFWLNVPIGLLLAPLVLARVPESFGPRAALDVGGLAFVTAGALGFTWGLVRASTLGWGDTEVVAALVGGVVALAAFALWERRAPAPMLPVEFFRSRGFSAGNLTALLQSASIFGAAFFMAQFLQTSLQYGPLGAGIRLAPWTATLFVVAPRAGKLINRVGERALLALGLSLQGFGFAWLAFIAKPGLAYILMVPPMVVSGCGTSMAIPAAQNCVLGSVPRWAMGKASGALNTLRQLGGTFGIAIAAAVFSEHGAYTSAGSFSRGYSAALWAAAGLSLAGALAGAWAPSRTSRLQRAVPRPSHGAAATVTAGTRATIEAVGATAGEPVGAR
ncbi:MAG TPA: MFS transporter [Acidimicrobiales bacterium]|nr:MFS transporter [Acidimicrobiales bacterium]